MENRSSSLYKAIDKVKELAPGQTSDSDTPQTPVAPPPSAAIDLVRRNKEQAPKEPPPKAPTNPAIY